MHAEVTSQFNVLMGDETIFHVLVSPLLTQEQYHFHDLGRIETCQEWL